MSESNKNAVREKYKKDKFKSAIPQYITDLPWYLQLKSDSKNAKVENSDNDPAIKEIYDFSHHYLETKLSKESANINNKNNEAIDDLYEYSIINKQDKNKDKDKDNFNNELVVAFKEKQERDKILLQHKIDKITQDNYDFKEELEGDQALMSEQDEIPDSVLPFESIPTQYDDVSEWKQSLTGRYDIPVYMVTNKKIYDTLDNIENITQQQKNAIAALDNTIPINNENDNNNTIDKNNFIWKQYDRRMIKLTPQVCKTFDPRTHAFHGDSKDVSSVLLDYTVATSSELAQNLSINKDENNRKGELSEKIYKQVSEVVQKKAKEEQKQSENIKNEIDSENIFDRDYINNEDNNKIIKKAPIITKGVAKKKMQCLNYTQKAVKTIEHKNKKIKENDLMSMY